MLVLPLQARKRSVRRRKDWGHHFDYLLAETLYSGQLPKRSLLVIDAAHNLEQKILGFTDFEISPFALQKYSVPIPTIADGDIASASEWIQSEMIPAVDYFISEILEEDVERSESRHEAENLLGRMRRFVAGDPQLWAFWNSGSKLVFRPLSAAKYANNFLFSRSEMVIIMSATIIIVVIIGSARQGYPQGCKVTQYVHPHYDSRGYLPEKLFSILGIYQTLTEPPLH